MNLFSIAEWLATFGETDLRFDPDRCLHHGDRFATCQACFEVCPAGAITAGKPPVFNSNKCLSCKACLPVCPNGAYRAADPLAPLLQTPWDKGSGVLDLFCANNPRSQVGPLAQGFGYEVKGCLVGLSAGAYLALVAQGVRRVWVRTDACRDCPFNQLEAQIEREVARGRKLLGLWGQEDTLAIVAVLEKPVQRPIWTSTPSHSGVSRRDLFRMMIPRSEQVVRVTPPRPIENEAGLSRDRVQILQAASQFRLALRDPKMPLEGLGFSGLSVSDGCTACRACARACPTGALRFSTNETETAFRLSFLAEACNGCEACLHVCSPAAITLTPAPAADTVFAGPEAVTLHGGELARCERCQTPFAARNGQRRCSLCEYRAVHPFGSILPPGFSHFMPRTEGENRL